MSIDGETLSTLGTGVDETETVGLAGLELELGDTSIVRALGLVSSSNSGAVEVALAVDEVVVREDQARGVRGQNVLNDVEVLLVVPIRKEDGADINVVGRLSRAVDDNGAGKTTGILRRVVRVVPRGSVESSLR